MLINKLFQSTIALVAIIGNVKSQCTGNIVTNGSFNSPTGTYLAAPGWTAESSPDINDDSGFCNANGYLWTGTPLASPDGGTWQSIFFTESISQLVTLNVAKTYDICFFFAAQGITNGPNTYTAPVGVAMTISGTTYTTQLDYTQFTWEKACFTFTTNSTSTLVKFEPTTYNYVGIDGMCLIQSVSTGVLSFNELFDWRVFPNPADDNIEIDLTDEQLRKIEKITLYNSLSELILQTPAIRKIDVTAIVPGLYFLEISSQGAFFKRPFVISR